MALNRLAKQDAAPNESAQHFKTIFDDATDAILLIDLDGYVCKANPEACRMHGFSRDEFVGKQSRELIHPDCLWQFDEAIAAAKAGQGYETESIDLRKNGEPFPIEVRLSPSTDQGETMLLGFIRDITARQQTEDAMKIQGAHLEQRVNETEQQLKAHQEHLESLVQKRTAELEQALEAAQIADRTKDEFLANITHDLRTPLSAMIGFSGLARAMCTDTRQRDYLDKVNNAGKTLSSLINDLLDLSKIAAGSMELDVHPFSLHQLIARCISMISYKAEEKGVILSPLIDEKIPDILVGDGLRIEQIVLNLLANAVKFTPCGQVALHVSLAEPVGSGVGLAIEVKDSGIGMSEALIARLFEPFRQGDASMTRRFGGTGLGLVICKRLVELMGGEINVSSQEHHGSLFTITLCLGLGEANSLPVEEPVESAQASVRVHYDDVRVLVADDQPLNRDLVHGLLSLVGISPNFARNGQEAVDILAHSTENYDLVLMDIQMPIMDGLTATRSIRMNTRFAQLPIIAMTAHTMMHEKEACLQAGMNDHLGKPFDEALFYQTLTRWIPTSKQQLHRAVEAAPVTTDQHVGLPALSGVDVSTGLSFMQGNETRYRHWLEVFVNQAPILIKSVRAALLIGEHDPASMAAHTLKGNTGLLSMKELHACAAALEVAINDAQPTDALLLDLECGIAAMCAQIVDKLGLEQNAESAAEVEFKSLPALPSPSRIFQLIVSLDRGDGDCDHYVELCLQELAQTAWAPPLRAAQRHILKFDFAAASRLLSDLQG